MMLVKEIYQSENNGVTSEEMAKQSMMQAVLKHSFAVVMQDFSKTVETCLTRLWW